LHFLQQLPPMERPAGSNISIPTPPGSHDPDDFSPLILTIDLFMDYI
jgi:hypothetical protein